MQKELLSGVALNAHEISAVIFASVFMPLGAMCCVSVLLSAVGVQKVLGSTPYCIRYASVLPVPVFVIPESTQGVVLQLRISC